MPSSIFLCHSTQDKAFARKLFEDLESRGIRVWIDECGLLPGDSLIGTIEKAIDEMDYLGIVLSDSSVKSPWCMEELRMAMYNGICASKVAVIPLLYRDCKIPGFLREKLYVDFRSQIDYDHAVAQLLRRMRQDFKDEMAKTDIPEAMDSLPFTHMWRTALATNSFSARFLNYTRETLGSMVPDTPSWNPTIAISYTAFIVELVEEGKISRDSWNFICDIVECSSIVGWLRCWTLDRTLRAASRLDKVRVPNVIETPGVPFYENVVSICLFALFDPQYYKGISEDARTPVRILSFLWAFGDERFRDGLYDRISGHVMGQLIVPTLFQARLKEIRKERSVPRIESIFSDLRTLYASHFTKGSKPKDSHALHDAFERYKAGTEEISPERVLELFLSVSDRCDAERHDFDLYGLTIPLFKDIGLLRRRQGDEPILKTLFAVINEDRLDLELSCFALLSLISEFEPTALYLDDRFPVSLFRKRGKGKEQHSILEILCELVAGEEKGKTEMAYALLAVSEGLEGAHKKRLEAMVETKAGKCKRLAVVLALMRNEITMSRALKKLGVT